MATFSPPAPDDLISSGGFTPPGPGDLVSEFTPPYPGDLIEPATATATTPAKRPFVYDPDPERITQSGTDTIDAVKAASGYIGNVARAIPADVAAGLSLFKRPEDQPATLLPSPTAIAGAIQKNLPAAAEASGNIPAALMGEPMPIDAILSAASKEDKTAATIGKISQGLAATAPMAAIGALPAVAQKLALIGFTAKMMSDAPEIATQLGDELGKPEDQRDPDKLTTLISDAVQVVGFSTLGATHLIKSGAKVVSDYADNLTPRGTGISPELERLAPATAQATAETIKQTEVQPASETLTPATDAEIAKSIPSSANSPRTATATEQPTNIPVSGEPNAPPPPVSPEIKLGIDRPDIEDPSLKTLTEKEFDSEFRSAKKAVNQAEKSLDEVGDTTDLSPEQRQSIAKSQDRWSAASLERLRRNNLDIHTEDIFRQMNDLADLGSESAYAKFKVLTNILKERGGVKPADATGSYSTLPDRLLSNPDFKEALGGKLQKTKDWLERMQKDQPVETPSPGVSSDIGSRGPGAAAASEPGTYDPAAQLSDALKTIKEPDPLRRAEMMEKAADVWEAGKTAAQKAWGRVVAAKESIKSNLLTLPETTPLKRLISALDFQIQKSSAMSRDLGKSFETSHPNRTRRNGIAILVDAGLDVEKVRAAIANLPASTPRRVRSAFEAATELTPAERDTAERIRQYFNQRLEDAQQAGVLDKFIEDYYTHVWKRPERMPEELKNAMSNGRVVSYFDNARQRKLDDFITGVKLGFEPVLDPALVLPKYNFNLDRAIASRAFVKKLSETTEADGRPTVAPTGIGKVIEGEGNPATIIKPNVKSGEASDYRPVDNPALKKWKWATNAPDGTPIMIEGDLVVHPDALQRIKNIMERERLTAGKTMRGLIRVGAEVKGAKLGVLSPFHQIHVGSHAVWHLVNPFSLKPEIDWTHPSTRFAVEKGGLKLAADFHDKMAFSEGLGPGLIAQKIVPFARTYSEWLFESFIPRLKLKTFEAVYQRDLKRYAGKLSEEQIASRSGDAVNNAYGELNRLWLGKSGRDPRVQRAMQVTLLAPDFLEARGRFIAKAFTKYGKEEQMSLLVMGVGMYTAARILNQLIDGDPHADELGMAFSVRMDGKNYSIRSVIGDAVHLLSDWRSFTSHRINPITTRTAVETVTGRDLRTGEKRTAFEQAQDMLSQIRPSQLDSLSAKDRDWWDGFVQSMGVTARHQPTPEEIAKKKAKEEKEAKHPSKVEIIYKKGFSHEKAGIQPTKK